MAKSGLVVRKCDIGELFFIIEEDLDDPKLGGAIIHADALLRRAVRARVNFIYLIDFCSSIIFH